ncbi:MAG: anthranilate phosphoribosyltransferase [Rhizobiales bacterium]|nr:anthranilate phosphoribosyltransferase [Hyphomicrobiales bacterium]
MARIEDYIQIVSTGESLSREQSAAAFELLMTGQAEPAQIGGFLMALRVRGETVDEITGAAEVMRAKATGVQAPEGSVDTCGTGGDSSGTYNISTCSSFVVAGAGIPVAKHGNKSISSKSGSADVLASLGVNLDVTPEIVEKCIEQANIGFMFAPAHHSAVRHVGPARASLGVRTIFNLLGPLSNPAGAKRQVLGVFSDEWLVPIAEVLRTLGSTKLWVVHGADGLDELSTTGETKVAALDNGEITTFTVHPEEVGLPLTSIDMLKGGDSEVNAVAIKEVLKGEMGPFRDIVLLNAAAALVVSGKVNDLKEAVGVAANAIDDGKALEALEQLITLTNG